MTYATLYLEDIFTVLLFIIGFGIVIYAQNKVNHTYQDNKNRFPKNKLSGVEVARKILDANGLSTVHVVETRGELTDHYDPNRKVIRLSSDVFHKESIAAISVAAHECGHAMQDKEGYTFMRIRSMLVPVVRFVTYIGYFISAVSLMMGMIGYLKVGIFIICITILFQLITLPVELDASARAKKVLIDLKIIEIEEKENVHKMLSAAALTYIASILSSLTQLFRLLILYNKKDK